jgi:glutamyl-tRNA synthetase
LQFEETCATHQLKPGEVLQLLRIFVSGQSGGVDLFGMLALLGASECANRLTAAMEYAVKKA